MSTVGVVELSTTGSRIADRQLDTGCQAHAINSTPSHQGRTRREHP